MPNKPLISLCAQLRQTAASPPDWVRHPVANKKTRRCFFDGAFDQWVADVSYRSIRFTCSDYDWETVEIQVPADPSSLRDAVRRGTFANIDLAPEEVPWILALITLSEQAPLKP